MDNDTLFEQIINGDLPSYKIHEDDHTYAFLDIKPVNPGHTLVIPKRRYPDLFTIPQADFLAVMNMVHQLAPIIQAAVNADGINIANNNGQAAGQVVWHYHVHIIPRYDGDGHGQWHGNTVPTAEEFSAIQTRVQKELL